MPSHSCPSPKSEHLTLDEALKSPIHPNSVSLWLVPTQGKLLSRLEECVKDLSEKTGTRHFSPHVSLLSWIPFDNSEQGEEDFYWQLTKVVSEWIKSTGKSSLHVNLEGIETPDADQTAFYRCLYMNVHQNSSLIALHRLAQQLVHSKSLSVAPPITPVNQPYFPVMSLAYGNTTPQQRQELVDYIKKEYSDLLQGDEGFESREIQVWSTSGSMEKGNDVDNWTLLAKIQLTKGAQVVKL